MQMNEIPFGTTDWSQVPETIHKGETGVATWRTRQFGTIRVRMVEYSPGYLADHWCEKGHILLVLGGTIPEEDHPRLKQNGVSAIFGPGTPLETTVQFIRDNVKPRGMLTS